MLHKFTDKVLIISEPPLNSFYFSSAVHNIQVALYTKGSNSLWWLLVDSSAARYIPLEIPRPAHGGNLPIWLAQTDMPDILVRQI